MLTEEQRRTEKEEQLGGGPEINGTADMTGVREEDEEEERFLVGKRCACFNLFIL